MGIKLTYEQLNVSGNMSVKGAVVHFGANIPYDKPGVTLHGQGVADHHGKIFYAYNSFRYVNLTEEPTRVLRGSGFSFELDPFMPQCEVSEGDRLKFGPAIVEITKLIPPVPDKPVRVSFTTDKLNCRYPPCRRCKSSGTRERKVVRITSELAYQFRSYTYCPEILRVSVDWLVELFKEENRKDCPLNLGNPRAIMAWPLDGATRLYKALDVPIKKSLGTRSAMGKSVGILPREKLNTGLAFQFIGRDNKKMTGMATGILDETCYVNGVPSAGHFILVQYPPGIKPTTDDLCVLHHVASHISDALAGVEAAKLRRQHELERRGGIETRGLFHDMIGFCKDAGKSIDITEADLGEDKQNLGVRLNDAKQNIQKLMLHIRRGQDAFETDQGFHYQWLDVTKVCRDVLNYWYNDSVALRQTRSWCVSIFSNKRRALREVPADSFVVEQQILFNLIRNSRRALDERGPDILVKRVHILLDLIKQDKLPYMRIRVVDDGCGMGTDALRTIFEGRFSTKKGRHGLGTQVVAERVQRHCGFIEVASEEGKGTVVGILLPAPVKNSRVKFNKDAEWLAPYRKLSMRRALINRSDLESLLRKDRNLNDWYRLQGRQKSCQRPK